MPKLNVLSGGRTADGRREYIVPDLVLVNRNATYDDGDLAEPPLSAVEILSPGQTIGDLFIRAERYTNADLREVAGKLTGSLDDTVEVPLAALCGELAIQ